MMCPSVIARLLCIALLGAALTACTGKDYHLAVQVRGLSGSGLVLVNNGADPVSVSGNGTHEFRVSYPFAYPYKVSVQTNPTGPEQLCTVVNGQGRLTSDVDNVQVTCIDAYRVSGTVTDLVGNDLVLINNQTERLTITASGAFTFSRLLEDNSSYLVEVLQQPTNQLCRVDNPSGVISGGNVSNVQVICGTRTIGGTLTGLVGGQIELQNNGTEKLIRATNGSFTFLTTFYDGADYSVAVSVQPTSQLCAVSNASGTVAGANITDIGVLCGYTVGGTISGPSGNQVVLQLNGANNLTLGMNRSFAFQVGLPTGTPYDVTLLTIPDGLSCQIVNGSGTIATSPVSDVAVNCREGPTVTVDYDVKQVLLDWGAVSGIDFYRVFRSTDAGANFTQISGDITDLDYIDPVDVHRTDWVNLSYKVQSCNAAGCADSNVISPLNSALATGYVKASNTGQLDRFGAALALSGDGNTFAVGAPGEDSAANAIDGNEADDCADAAPVNCAGDSGAVYVYANDNGTWSRQAYVKPSNTGTGDQFGYALGLSSDGNTLVVGAPFEDSNGSGGEGDDSASDSGAAYVFTRSGASWSQQAYVKASNVEAGDGFGQSIALASVGTTLAVGAPLEDGNGSAEGDNSAADSGAVYVFAESGGSWSQQAYVKASNVEAGDGFGRTVALADTGDTLAAGAPLEDGNGSGEGDNSAADSGAAYVFTRSGISWSQQAYVKASNAEAGDEFSLALALAGDGATLAVGAPLEDSAVFPTIDDVVDDCEGPAPTNCAEESGAVYVYGSVSGAWSELDYLKASNLDVNDLFGSTLELSIDGGTLAVGALGEASRSSGIGGEKTDNLATASGAVYLFERSASVWNEGAYVKAANTGQGDHFGQAIGLSDDTNTLVVTAPLEDSAASLINGTRANDCDAATPTNCAEDSGAAYIF